MARAAASSTTRRSKSGGTLIVGATMGDPVRHPLEPGPVHRLVWIREDVADYAAHQGGTSGPSTPTVSCI